MGRRLLLMLAVLGSLLAGSPTLAAWAPPPSECAACSGCCCCASQPEGCGCLAPARPDVPSCVPRAPHQQVPGCLRPAARRLARPPLGPVVFRSSPPRAPAYPLRAHLLLEQISLPPPA